MQPSISIIVPIYNAETFLKQCLDSIILQTYGDFEVLCVDDDSEDKSLEILQEYKMKDERIRIFHKENEGVSKARNLALQKMRGKFVLFVDSDDWIEPETCEKAIEAAVSQNADIVIWPYIRELGSESRKKFIFEHDIVFDEDEAKRRLHRRMIGIYGDELKWPENADALCTVWGKLYRADIIVENKLFFEDIREIGTYEDGLFNLNYFQYVSRAVYFNRYLYHYRRGNSNTITNIYNPDLLVQWNKLFDILEMYIRDNNMDETYEQALNNRISLSLIQLGINAVLMDKPVVTKVEAIRNVLQNERYRGSIKTLCMDYFPVHWKIFFSLAKHQCAVSVYILLLVIQKIRGR